MADTLAWGLDLGGTKLEAVAFRTSDPLKPLARLRRPTNADRGYESVIANIGELIDQLASEVGERPQIVGVGHPGSTDHLGLIKNSNTLALNGKPLRNDLSARLLCGVLLENDANCFALAEAELGAGKGFGSVFGVILGTGVGGGIIIGGQVLAGRHQAAGEWGHNVVAPLKAEDSARHCYCGRSGCIETWISSPALEQYYTQLSESEASLADIAETAKEVSLKLDRLSAVDDGHRKERAATASSSLYSKETAATMTMMRLLDYFGAGMAQVVNVLDPDCIVLGGGLSNLALLYEKGPMSVAANVFNPEFSTPIFKNALGDSAGVFGAALLTVKSSNCEI